METNMDFLMFYFAKKGYLFFLMKKGSSLYFYF